MRVNDFILAVDIGTSATKAVLFDTDAKQISIARSGYPIHAPYRGWSEQEPDTIFHAAVQAMQAIVASLPANGRILGVSFSSQLYSVLALGPDGRPLTNSLTWSDTRSAHIAQAIGRRPEAAEIYRKTGCPIDAIYPLAKIQWLKEEFQLPENVKFVSVKEYVISRLIDQLVVDWSIASATGLLDIREHRWDETALSVPGITAGNLSELVPPKHIVTEWNRELIRHIGLSPGTPLVVGGGDGPLASMGVGAWEPGTLAVNVGTSAAARSTVREAQVDPQGRLWTYVVDEGLWVVGGIVSSGGIVYDWFLRNFFSGSEYADVNDAGQQARELAEQLAAGVPAGAENLIFIPYLGGEQCPVWNPHTRGGFLGLDFRHHRGHLARAVLEGITRSIYRVSESIQAMLNCVSKEVRVTGGLTYSSLWLQIAADMFGVPIVLPESVEGSARGAAMLAAVALGLKSNISEFVQVAAAARHVQPNPQAQAYYRQQARQFQELLDCARKYKEMSR